jgi:hypothetical protein
VTCVECLFIRASGLFQNMDISDIDYEQQLIEEELERVNRKIAALERRRHELEKQLEQCNERRAQKVQATQPPEPDWASEAFSWSETLRRLALEYWKIRQYRPMQLCVLNAVMHGRDVLAVMPTGKSLRSITYYLAYENVRRRQIALLSIASTYHARNHIGDFATCCVDSGSSLFT